MFLVHLSNYDATRPYVVVATFRTFNQVKGRYATRAQADQRARYLNRRAAALGLAR